MVEDRNKYTSIFTKFVENTKELVKKIKIRESKLDVASTELERLLEQYELGYIKTFLPPRESSEKSRKRWNEFLENNNSNIFSEEDIYNFAFEYHILSDPKYWKVLEKTPYIDEKILFAIVRNFHYYWRDLDNFELISKQIPVYLKRIKSDKKIIETWKKKSEIIIGDKNVRLESRILSVLKHNITEISKIYKNKLYDIEKNDLLANLIKYEYILHIYGKTDFINNFEENFSIFKDFYEYSLRPILRKVDNREHSQTLNDKRNHLLSIIIEKLNQHNYNVENYKQNLIDFVLESPLYGDPRNHSWFEYNNEKTINIFKSWLNERDIEIFFDILISDDPHDRKGFWKRLSDRIDNSLFVFGNGVESNRNYQQQIKNIKNSSSKNVVTIGSDSNLINANIAILTINNYTFIEFFSEKANACYVYDSEFYKQEIRYLLATNHSRMKIKKDLSEFKQQGYLKKFNHDQNGIWMQNILDFLENNP